jgi:hypothetical protein
MAAVIDLKRVNAVNFVFNVACRVNDAMRTEIEKIIGKKIEVGKGWSLGVVRRKGEHEWVVFARFEYVEEEGPHLHATFVYGLKNIPHPPKDVLKPYRLIQILSMAEEPLIFLCEASFLYEDSIQKSTIQLPIPLFRTEEAGFHEIRGVLLARTKPEEFKYEIKIEARENGSLIHEIAFPFTSRAKPGVESTLLKKAVAISYQFLE